MSTKQSASLNNAHKQFMMNCPKSSPRLKLLSNSVHSDLKIRRENRFDRPSNLKSDSSTLTPLTILQYSQSSRKWNLLEEKISPCHKNAGVFYIPQNIYITSIGSV